MRHSAVTMQAKDDRLETDYRPHSPSAHQQGSRGTTFESLSKDAGCHGGVRTGEIFRDFRAECRRCEMVFRGGGEIPPRGLENQSAGGRGPAWRSAGRDSSGRRGSADRRVCFDAASGFDAGAGFAIRTESGGARIFRGGHQRDPAGSREFSEHTNVFRAGEKGPSPGTPRRPEQAQG